MNELAVLIPVYDDQTGLDRTLSSLRLSNSSFDVIVIDDGSPVPASVPPYLREDTPVFLLRLEKNAGIAAALNHGLTFILARDYRYIARLDCADSVEAGRFQEQKQFLDANSSCGVVSSFVDFIDTGQTSAFRFYAPCTHDRIVRRLRLSNCMIHSATMIRTAVLKRVGLYREDVPGAEDYELFLRIARAHRLAVLPKVLTQCAYDLRGLSVAGRRQQQRTRLRLQLDYFDPTSILSFVGVARTLIAMAVPHSLSYRLKRLRPLPRTSANY